MAEIKTIAEIIKDVSSYYAKKGEPEAEHKMVYESYSETLEPVYFFILDLMNDFGLNPEKLIDNFSDAPGSQHFTETGLKAQRMQDEASKIMQTIGVLIRSILQIIYDLKDFRIRLQSYDDFKSKDKSTSEGARLSLKQIWLDKVDLVSKGQSSIKAMALGQAGFQTLLDAFLIAKDEKEADKLDLNDRIKRIVKSRINEFNIWLEQSEKELRKRYEIEKNYLKSQVNSLKLYSRWVRPYLKAAQDLESKDLGRNPNLVKSFNRIILELTLLGKSKIKVEDAALAGDLPKDFQKMKLKRDYYSCILVDFNFRALPQQGNFLGRAEITFRAYALNDDEIKMINQKLDESDLGDALRLIEGTAGENLEQMQEEINFFLEDKEKEKSGESSSEGNPFSALFGKYNTPAEKKPESKSDTKKEEKITSIKSDNWIEKTHLRNLAAQKSTDTAFDLFDIYKKAHGMVSYA